MTTISNSSQFDESSFQPIVELEMFYKNGKSHMHNGQSTCTNKAWLRKQSEKTEEFL